MDSTTLEREPVLAREEERPAIKRIEDLYERQSGWTVKFTGPAGEETIVLPETVARAFRQVVHALAKGEAVSIVPVHKELTTQQAADLLNVSRQYLVRLLDGGEIPFHKVGTHRRVTFGDVMAYKQRRDRKRRKNLADLTRMSQDMGLYQ